MLRADPNSVGDSKKISKIVNNVPKDDPPEELNWHSILSSDECLQMTVEWYKMFYEVKPHEAMYEFCTRQIVEYVERAKKRNQIWVDKIRTRT